MKKMQRLFYGAKKDNNKATKDDLSDIGHTDELPIATPSHVRVATSDRFLTSSRLMEDDSIHREASVNPSIFKTVDQYQIDRGHSLPKVLLLFCGGTLIMKENPDDGSLIVNEKDDAINMLLEMEPKLQKEVASLSVEFIDNIDSSNMNPQIWDRLGRVIFDNYKKYDGFVITHGTDTMAYTSSALSFVLQDIGRPVVITGAQIPGGRIETDARRNFVNAVRIATLDRAGIFLVFDGDIILGGRAHKMSESKLDAFAPVNWSLIGEIRIDIRFSDDAKPRHNRPLRYLPGFDHKIAVYTIFPGFSPTELRAIIERGSVRGIILASYGSGNISYRFMDVIKFATSNGIAVVITTQCLEGATLMHLYDVGRQALEAGAIQAYDMSTECTIAKLMWALHRSQTVGDVQSIMHTNYTGEINIEGHNGRRSEIHSLLVWSWNDALVLLVFCSDMAGPLELSFLAETDMGSAFAKTFFDPHPSSRAETRQKEGLLEFEEKAVSGLLNNG
ncbi:L-asparaginase I [Nitzschia inconspicua]|uniref:asparaginase n=1 Tax=Nitzschia inconspicua TaxID=303405 RepID=A0A9K3KC21_9STRA|nr:L-asparaginase I [Nitzschia inconspicua]